MKNLIEEIEKALQDTERLYRHTSEIYNGYLKSHYRGKMEAFMNILESLKDYNIITAPKSIMLSEIVNRLQETIKEKLSVKNEMWCEKAIGYYTRDWEDDDFDELVGFDKEMKIIHINLNKTEFKWLYTLWIAGTEIIDDLEGEE